MPPTGDVTLGGWNLDDLQNTVRDYRGVGADHDLSRELRFISGVCKLVRRREALAEGGDALELAVFLLTGKPLDGASSTRVPMLNNGMTPLAGRVWAVNEAVVSGHRHDLDTVTDDTVFRYLIETHAVGGVPAVVVDPRSPVTTARFYPDGLEDMDKCVELRLSAADLSVAEIEDAISRHHSECLITPDLHGVIKLWQDNAKCYPIAPVETTIQQLLRCSLVQAFPSCEVRAEIPGRTGRLDLRIHEPDPLMPHSEIKHAVLELKVVKTYGSTGKTQSPKENRDWVKKGVEQAGAYRQEREYRLAMLVCYDMCKNDVGDDEYFEPVAELAEALKVRCRRWYLYSTADRYRQALAERGASVA